MFVAQYPQPAQGSPQYAACRFRAWGISNLGMMYVCMYTCKTHKDNTCPHTPEVYMHMHAYTCIYAYPKTTPTSPYLCRIKLHAHIRAQSPAKSRIPAVIKGQIKDTQLSRYRRTDNKCYVRHDRLHVLQSAVYARVPPTTAVVFDHYITHIITAFTQIKPHFSSEAFDGHG